MVANCLTAAAPPGADAKRNSDRAGAHWTFWRVPMMLWSPGAAIPTFIGLTLTSVAIYPVQITGITILMTVLFLSTNGSVLLAVLAHLTCREVSFAGCSLA
jgi:hypothetical protein